MATVNAESADSVAESLSSNPTLTEGLLGLFTPVVKTIDESVAKTQESQVELRNQIEALQTALNTFQSLQNVPVADLDAHIQRLARSRARIQSIATLLNTVQDRVNKLHQNVSRASRQLAEGQKKA